MKGRFTDWIIYEDEHVLAINKPAHLSSLDERDTTAPSVLRYARNHVPDVQLCHRIDKETSGVLLMAKHGDAYREISMAFEDRRVEKIYHAVVEGAVKLEELVVEQPIYVGKAGKVKIDFEKGKEALTLFSSLEIFKNYTLMECMPVTGRMHQIRIHLASQNLPICGDIQYGGHWPYLSRHKKNFNIGKFEEEKPMITRFALHAYSLYLQTENFNLELQAPYPKDFEILLKLIRKYGL